MKPTLRTKHISAMPKISFLKLYILHIGKAIFFNFTHPAMLKVKFLAQHIPAMLKIIFDCIPYMNFSTATHTRQVQNNISDMSMQLLQALTRLNKSV
jgi:hypothetical protein